jgi:DNA-binding NtrC family response regulator
MSNSSDDQVSEQGESLADATRDFQKRFILDAVAAAQGNMSEAARRLRMGRNNLYKKLEQLGLPTRSAELCF